MYRITGDQMDRLVQIIREESGDKLSRTEFTDAMLRLFEDVAGFETLPRKVSQRYLMILWQSYQSGRPAPARSARNQHGVRPRTLVSRAQSLPVYRNQWVSIDYVVPP